MDVKSPFDHRIVIRCRVCRAKAHPDRKKRHLCWSCAEKSREKSRAATLAALIDTRAVEVR